MVLQDNGTDAATVSANGSFSFPTALAAGATYNVTVEANPTGQACTVANGSGTVLAANVATVAVSSAAASSPTLPASDNFDRANGNLGPNWTNMAVGGLAIANDQVTGTSPSGNSGDIRTAETYTSDQYSELQVGSAPLSGTQWIGPAVRAQAGGQSLYIGIYYWNNGSPLLMLFKLVNGTWTPLGTPYSAGPLAPGTELQLMAVGSSVSLAENGVVVVSATDSSLTGGAPAIMAYGTSTAGPWSGGDATGTYSIGGTVSGLTGTVVLQDNGTDAATVSANGSFSFPTALAAGATYNVTVEANPTGQACTVANGSGTVLAANVATVAVSCAAAP